MKIEYLEALAVDNGWAALIVFLLGDPHLLEGGQRSKDGSSNPDRVLPLWWSNDLDLDGGWGKSGDKKSLLSRLSGGLVDIFIVVSTIVVFAIVTASPIVVLFAIVVSFPIVVSFAMVVFPMVEAPVVKLSNSLDEAVLPVNSSSCS